jgi:non-specific serine/threonine protein kinase
MTDDPRQVAAGDNRGSLVAFPWVRVPKKKRPPGNLPLGLSSFIGRKREMTEIKRLLSSAHLLTLTGPGDCGKTRLALETAKGLVEDFEDGAWWAELASFSDPDLVPQAVAQALNVRSLR